MKYLIISDIHSNPMQLRTILEKEKDTDAVLCCGDIVGYYPYPNETIDIIKNSKIETVLGNHDYACINLINAIDFKEVALDCIIWTHKAVTKENMDFLKSLPFVIEKNNFVIVHGTLTEPEEFKYIQGPRTALMNILKTDKHIVFTGHSHEPIIYEYDIKKDKVSVYNIDEKVFGEDLQLDSKKQYIVNVGSVGQPRDDYPSSCYVIYDDVEDTVIYRRLAFDPKDLDDMEASLEENGLNTYLITRLEFGC